MFPVERKHFSDERIDIASKRAKPEDSLAKIVQKVFSSPSETGHTLLECAESQNRIPIYDPKIPEVYANPASYVTTEVYLQYIDKCKKENHPLKREALESHCSSEDEEISELEEYIPSEDEDCSTKFQTDYTDAVLQDMKDLKLAYTDVILPLLLSRNYIIRPPILSDEDSLVDFLDPVNPLSNTIYAKDVNFYNTRYKEVARAFGMVKTSEGTVHRIFLVHPASDTSKNNAVGLIHFEVMKEACYVFAINVDTKAKGTGLATVLMGLAYKVALVYKCTRLEVEITDDAGPFYVALGLRPDAAPYDEWDSLELSQKLKMTQLINCTNSDMKYTLDFTVEKARKIFEDRLEKSLSKDYQGHPYPKIDLNSLTLPESVWNMKWLATAKYVYDRIELSKASSKASQASHGK